MGTGYTRNDTVNNIADGNIINASDLDGEFDALQSAFDAATGHTHDGTTGEGAPIEVTGPAQEYVSTGTELRPKANNTYDLGSASNQWKDLYVDGTANLDTVDIDAGNIDGTVIGAATPAAGTFTTAAATTGNITTVNATTVDTTNIEVTNIKAKDGTAAGSIADSTGVVTLASSVLTTTDINGGTIDGATIATSDITVGTGKTLNVSSGTLTLANDQISGDKVEGGTINAITINTLGSTTGNITTVNATTVDSTNLEVTNIKAKDGTASATIADSTGVMTIASSVLTTADINGGTIDGTVIGGSTPAAISGTTITGTSFVSSGNMTFGDGDSAFFGDSNDLQIVHNGSHSYIADSGTGNLYIQTTAGLIVQNSTGTETMATFTENGAVQLYYDNATKLATTATGIDVTGTITSDGLTVGGDALFTTGTAITLLSRDLNTIRWDDGVGSPNGTINASISSDTSPALIFSTRISGSSPTERVRIDSSGNVGIGTSSPAVKLDIAGASVSTPALILRGDAGTGNSGGLALYNSSTDANQRNWYLVGNSSSYGDFAIRQGASQGSDPTSGTNRFYIANSGNVGIGTSSPSSPLDIESSVSSAEISLNHTGSGGRDYRIGSTGTGYGSAGNLIVYDATASSERMRLDSSGNLLVGATAHQASASSGSGGQFIGTAGSFAAFARSGDVPLYLNRISTGGDIVQFRRNGTTVGSIGVSAANELTISSQWTDMFSGSGVALAPLNADDATADLGSSSGRFKNLYLSGGVYLGGTTSANLLDDYEEGTWTPTLTAASNCSGLSLAYAWYVRIGNMVFYSISGGVTVTSSNTMTTFTFTQAFTQAVQAEPQGGSAVIEGPSPFPYAAGTAFNSSAGNSNGFAAFGASAVDFNGASFFSITGSFRAA